MTTTMVVLFNLREGVDAAAYEEWARTRDAVTVRSLPSIEGFRVVRIAGALRGDAPYEYVELIEINDMERFGEDIAGDEMTRVAEEFQQWADNPLFIHGEEVA